MRERQACIVLHAEHGDPKCCGLLFAIGSSIVCNECGTVVRKLANEKQAAAALSEMASTEICSARCPYCQALNTFQGFTTIKAFTCQECGAAVVVEPKINSR